MQQKAKLPRNMKEFLFLVLSIWAYACVYFWLSLPPEQFADDFIFWKAVFIASFMTAYLLGALLYALFDFFFRPFNAPAAFFCVTWALALVVALWNSGILYPDDVFANDSLSEMLMAPTNLFYLLAAYATFRLYTEKGAQRLPVKMQDICATALLLGSTVYIVAMQPQRISNEEIAALANRTPMYQCQRAMSLIDDKLYPAAFKLLKMAAEQSFPPAQYNLGLLYEAYADDVSATTGPNFEEAAKWYKAAGEGGLAEAQYAMGQFYKYGTGVPSNWTDTMYWYRRAALQGYPDALFMMGLRHQKGDAVQVDLDESRKWYLLAAEKGHAGAQYDLGVYYTHAMGVEKDYAEAYFWLALAANNTETLCREKYCTGQSRDTVGRALSAAQREKGDRRVAVWKRDHPSSVTRSGVWDHSNRWGRKSPFVSCGAYYAAE